MNTDNRKTVRIPLTEFELDFRAVMKCIYEIACSKTLTQDAKVRLIEQKCTEANMMMRISSGYTQVLEEKLNEYNDVKDNFAFEQEHLKGLTQEAAVLAKGGYMHPEKELIHRRNNKESWS